MYTRGETGRRWRTVVTMAVGGSLAATLAAAGPGSGSPAFAADAALPSVTITSPETGVIVRRFDLPGSTPVTIVADPQPVSGTEIERVEFSRGGQVVSTVTAAPYEYVVSPSWAGPREFTAVAVDDAENSSEPATVVVVSNPGPRAYLPRPADWRPVLAVDDTDQSIQWSSYVWDEVNSDRPPDDPRIWIDHAEIRIDGEVAETITGEGCVDCPASGRPTRITQNFTWDPAATGLGDHVVTFVAVDSAGFTGAMSTWRYTVINRPVLTLRGIDGVVLPETIRVPSGSTVGIDAEVMSDGPTNQVRSVQLWVDGSLVAEAASCPAPTYCPASAVVKKAWQAAYTGMHELRVVAEDRWGIQTTATRQVDVYPGTVSFPTSRCCEIELGQTATVIGRLVRWDYGEGPGVPGARVSVTWRPAGAVGWQTVGTATTNSTGQFSLRHAPSRNGSYRFTYAGVPGTLGGSVGTGGAIVHSRVKGKFRKGEIHYGHVARIDVHTSRADPGSVWSLQKYRWKSDTWKTVATRHIPVNRHATFKVRPHRHGWNYYAIMRPSSAGYADSWDAFYVLTR